MLVVLGIEGMVFAGFLGAFIVLEGKRQGERLANTTSLFPMEWVPGAVLLLALLTITMARRGCRNGISLPSHWGANLGLVAIVGWFFVSLHGIIGAGAGSLLEISILHPADACWAALITLLALHLFMVAVVVGSGIPAMVGGNPDVAYRRLLSGERLLTLAVVVQIVCTTISFTY